MSRGSSDRRYAGRKALYAKNEPVLRSARMFWASSRLRRAIAQRVAPVILGIGWVGVKKVAGFLGIALRNLTSQHFAHCFGSLEPTAMDD